MYKIQDYSAPVPPITEEEVSELKLKTYTSGRDILVDEKVLFGIVVDQGETVDDGMTIPCTSLTFIRFHEDEIGLLYSIRQENPRNSAGIIRLKKL